MGSDRLRGSVHLCRIGIRRSVIQGRCCPEGHADAPVCVDCRLDFIRDGLPFTAFPCGSGRRPVRQEKDGADMCGIVRPLPALKGEVRVRVDRFIGCAPVRRKGRRRKEVVPHRVRPAVAPGIGVVVPVEEPVDHMQIRKIHAVRVSFAEQVVLGCRHGTERPAQVRCRLC